MNQVEKEEDNHQCPSGPGEKYRLWHSDHWSKALRAGGGGVLHM